MLSICIICKNEEQNIEKCLASFQNTGFEIIVVDTGSTDHTKEIALEYTPNVYDFEWCDDFSEAKNFAISKASNDVVMVIDSDEYLDQINLDVLKRLIEKYSGQVGRIKRRNVFHRNDLQQENREWINRIFSKKYFHYEGRIHEQVVFLNGDEYYETYEAPVTILHSGYDLSEEERKKKAERNIDLLDLELQRLVLSYKESIESTKNGFEKLNAKACLNYISEIIVQANEQAESLQHDDRLPYILYQLGKSYYMAGDYRLACTYFECGLYFDLNPKLEYVIDMVETYGYALINSGQAEHALFFENIYDEFGNTADFKFLMGLIYMNNEMFDAAVEEFKKAVKMPEGRTKGANSYLAYYNIGVIYECLGDWEEAKSYYEKCGTYPPACRQLAGNGKKYFKKKASEYYK